MRERGADPTALRFLIGFELRAARDRSGIRQADAAKVLGVSTGKLNLLETGKQLQQPDEVTTLLRLYGADISHIDRLASLAGRADQTTWWAPFKDVLPNWFKTFVGLQDLAEGQFAYSPIVLDGQLQTTDYALALYQKSLEVPPSDVPQVVKARIARQRLTNDARPLRFHTVIEEAVLDRIVGGPRVMREQLLHLLELTRRENVTLQIIPFAVPVHDGINGEFTILDFEGAQSLGYVEYLTGALYVQDREQVGLYKMSSERMSVAALSPIESGQLLEARVAKLGD